VRDQWNAHWHRWFELRRDTETSTKNIESSITQNSGAEAGGWSE
jgi:hypothetical protein